MIMNRLKLKTQNFDMAFYTKLASIAGPIALQQLVLSSLNLIDNFMISNLSKEAIAGVGAANKLFFLLNLFLFGMSSGSSILTSQYWGVKDIRSIKKVYGLSLTFAMSGAFLFMLAAVLTPAAVLRIFTKDALVIEEGVAYLRIVGFSYVFTSISFVTAFSLRSTNEVKLPMVVTMIAISLNTLFNYLLIFGHLGFPELGVSGAAIATVFARGMECVLLIFLVNVKNLPPSGAPNKIFVYTKSMTNKFLKIATPVVINEILWSTGVTAYAVVYGRMGTDSMATMTITQTIEQIAFVALIGIGNACGIMLGNSLGAGEGDKVFDQAKQFLKVCFVLGVVIGLICVLLAPVIAGIYNVDDDIRQNIISTLRVYGIFLPFKSINMAIIVGILRSGGDTTFSAILDAAGVWLVGVPLAFITGLYLDWALPYVYGAILFEEVFKIGFGLKRTYSKKWMNNLVEE